jgi:hypothetical protein
VSSVLLSVDNIIDYLKKTDSKEGCAAREQQPGAMKDS